MTELLAKLAYSIPELIESSSLGRSFIYDEIKAKRLLVRKAGSRTVVLADDARAWLASLPKLSGECKEENSDAR